MGISIKQNQQWWIQVKLSIAWWHRRCRYSLIQLTSYYINQCHRLKLIAFFGCTFSTRILEFKFWTLIEIKIKYNTFIWDRMVWAFVTCVLMFCIPNKFQDKLTIHSEFNWFGFTLVSWKLYFNIPTIKIKIKITKWLIFVNETSIRTKWGANKSKYHSIN